MGDAFWMFPVSSTIWFNTGYMLCQFTEAFGRGQLHGFFCTSPCIWQSLVQCILRHDVDTCFASVYEAFWLPHCRKLRTLRSCSSSKVVDIYVFTQFLFPMVLFVQKTIEIPQLLVDTMADVLFMLVVQCWLCRLRCTSRCVRFPGSQVHDARHHGRFGPDEQLCACSDLFKTGIAGGIASRAFAGMRGRLFGEMCIGTGRGGRVHRDTVPIIRCMRWLSWKNMVVIHTGPHHHHHHPSPLPLPSATRQETRSDVRSARWYADTATWARIWFRSSWPGARVPIACARVGIRLRRCGHGRLQVQFLGSVADARLAVQRRVHTVGVAVAVHCQCR